MSGHSKWATIKRRKGAEDAKRGKIFTRLARDITIAAREGGGDENGNAKLKLAIIKAKAANMPKDNIDRAVKRGTGELDDGVTMDEITYEGYGVEGVAFMIEVMTDNKNRILAEIKNIFNKNGGSLAAAGSVAWQFNQKGYITLTGDGVNFEEAFMVAVEAGADDVVDEDGTITVYTPREALASVERVLTDAGYEVDDSELRWIAQNEVEIAANKALQNMKIMEKLEELDDVQSVVSNMAMSDEVMAAFEAAN